MYKNKKISVLTLAMVLIMALSGCSSTGTTQDQNASENINTKTDEKIQVVATIFPPYDFAKNILGDSGNVSMLLPLGTESHTYEPTPKDMITIQNSDLLIYVGGVGDYWVEEILEALGDKAPETMVMMDAAPTLEEELLEGMTPDHDHEDEHEDKHEGEDHDHSDLDEHVWTSPKNAMVITQAISDKIAQLDPQHKELYQQNTQAYLQQLQGLDQRMETMIAAAKRDTIVVGDRFPFRYLIHDYHLKYYAAFAGCSTQTEPSASNIAFLANKVRDEEIPAVLYLEFSDHKVADAIGEMSGAKSLMLHSVHNISRADFEQNASYIQIMDQNIQTLKEVLN